MKRLILDCILVVSLLIIVAGSVSAQDYKIGPDDELSITFWQEPQLNTNVRVSQNGTIVLPVIGSMTAAGLTPNELALKIVRKISVFNKDISQASVLVTQYGSNKVYITGSVQKPGKYSFEVIPDLWKIILEAGGPTEIALLDQVQIIRGGDKVGEVTSADLTEFLKDGDVSKLPPIYAGDTIRIPSGMAAPSGAEMSAAGGLAASAGQTDIIYIYGQVAKPGSYPFARNLSLLEAIVIAGGPNTDAKMSQVKVITRGHPYSSVATIDLENYSTKGTPAPFLLRPGDTVFVPQKKSSGVYQNFQSGLMSELLRVIGTVAATILVYRLVQ